MFVGKPLGSVNAKAAKTLAEMIMKTPLLCPTPLFPYPDKSTSPPGDFGCLEEIDLWEQGVVQHISTTADMWALLLTCKFFAGIILTKYWGYSFIKTFSFINRNHTRTARRGVIGKIWRSPGKNLWSHTLIYRCGTCKNWDIGRPYIDFGLMDWITRDLEVIEPLYFSFKIENGPRLGLCFVKLGKTSKYPKPIYTGLGWENLDDYYFRESKKLLKFPTYDYHAPNLTALITQGVWEEMLVDMFERKGIDWRLFDVDFTAPFEVVFEKLLKWKFK